MYVWVCIYIYIYIYTYTCILRTAHALGMTVPVYYEYAPGKKNFADIAPDLMRGRMPIPFLQAQVEHCK